MSLTMPSDAVFWAPACDAAFEEAARVEVAVAAAVKVAAAATSADTVAGDPVSLSVFVAPGAHRACA